MKNIFKILIVILLTLLTIVSCDNNDKTQKSVQAVDKKELEELLIEANINMLSKESAIIDSFVNNKNLNVIKTGTGLRYYIEEAGEGDLIVKGNRVSLEYEVRFLNGKLVYSSDKDGIKTFVVGRGGVESGLEEAILFLRKNSVATIIIPSYLAHGMVGDGNRITQRATLVYKLKVIDIK